MVEPAPAPETALPLTRKIQCPPLRRFQENRIHLLRRSHRRERHPDHCPARRQAPPRWAPQGSRQVHKYTGGIAEMVAVKTGASVLTTTGEVPDWGDWWDNRDDEFTQILRNFPPRVKVVNPSIGPTESAPPSATERSQTTRSSRPPRVTRTPRTCRKRSTSQFSLSFPGANAAAKALSTTSPRQSLGSRQLIASPQKVYPQMEVGPKLQGRCLLSCYIAL